MALGTTSLAELAPPSLRMRRFSVDEYHRMIRAGVFADDERFELLSGWIAAKMTRSPVHDVVIGIIVEILRKSLPAGWHIRIQSAITTFDSEPEPDLAVVRGAIRDYLDHHPGLGEVALVIEVAESSLATDRELKARIYARAGIEEYWIVNLVDRRVEVHTGPTAEGYATVTHVADGEALPLRIEGREVARIGSEDLLP